MTVEKSEQEVLEGKLEKALAEAETKTSKALDSVTNKTEEAEKDIWAAAEAAEYASLVYVLTHSLDDSPVTTTRKDDEETLTIVRDASQNLKRVQTVRKQPDKDSLLEGYKILRGTTDSLRNTYLRITKIKTKPPLTS
ncbi:MAG TPA: hypothetical protein VEZ43_04520 [Dongiaceae bacterium]|nr:hypothetical protein [Dongiaceae bacterium]